MRARKLDYRWPLRQVMADRGMFATTDLIELASERFIYDLNGLLDQLGQPAFVPKRADRERA